MYDSSFKMADNNKIDKLEMESILIFKHVAKILNSEQVQQLKKGFEASLSLVTNCEVNSCIHSGKRNNPEWLPD